jgi:hypothetical protein
MKKPIVVLLAVAMVCVLPQWIFADPDSLSDEEMEAVFAKGISIDTGVLVGLSDSAIASDSSTAMDDVSDSNVQAGSGNTQTGQNQLNTENANVNGGDSKVINVGGDNRDQINLSKSVHIDKGAQNNNSGVIGNTSQGVFLNPINAMPVQSGKITGDLTMSSTNTMMMVNY